MIKYLNSSAISKIYMMESWNQPVKNISTHWFQVINLYVLVVLVNTSIPTVMHI